MNKVDHPFVMRSYMEMNAQAEQISMHVFCEF